MLMQEPTPNMVKAWKAAYDKYRMQLRPNKKTAHEIIEYLKQKYPLTETKEKRYEQIVIDNVLLNEVHANKISAGQAPDAKVFFIEDKGAGKPLYKQQDDVFKGNKIMVGVEIGTAFFMVEGSSLLWDELFAFRGLDKDDLNNYYLVAEYVSCLKKFDLLNSVLAH